MRVVRGVFAALLVLVAGCLGGFAALEGGALHGWEELSLNRLLRRGLVWAAGCANKHPLDGLVYAGPALLLAIVGVVLLAGRAR